MNPLEFYVFHNSAYPPVPHKSVIAKHSRTNYVSLPNTFYDKAIGQRVLEDLVDVVQEVIAMGSSIEPFLQQISKIGCAQGVHALMRLMGPILQEKQIIYGF